MRRTDVTRSISAPRRAAMLLAAMGAAGAMLVSGCGAGQLAHTAGDVSAVPGVNAQVNAKGGAYLIRNLVVTYRGTEGYPAGSDALLEMAIFNDTDEPVTVTVSTDSARSVVLTGATTLPPPPAATPTPGGPEASATGGPEVSPTEHPTATRTPRPTGSPQPLPTASVAPAGSPSIDIPARSFALLNRTGGQFIQLRGLHEELRPGETVNLQFDFNGQRLATQVPVTVPLSPAPVAPPVVEHKEG
jgi:hypothetical protein